MNKIAKILTLCLFLAGCHSRVNDSPEALTEKYVARMEKAFAGKKINREGLMNEAREIIKDAWNQGREDKEIGVSEEYVKERLDYYKNYKEYQLKNMPVREDVVIELINFYATMTPEMAEAYQAGYNSEL